MAKMFYTLEEVAEKLGKSASEVKQMADGGQLQIFRDGEKTMFKCTQVDAMADSSDRITLADGTTAPDPKGGTDPDLTGTGITIFDSDQIKAAGDSVSGTRFGSSTGSLTGSLTGSSMTGSTTGSSISGSVTGSSMSAIDVSGKSEPIRPVISDEPEKISVFDPDEVREADSMAATQADANFNMRDEDLALESVGSGSGLLDLTRETDDTSLGAELLDEIYPTHSTESQDIKMDTAAIGSTGIFDSNLRNTARVDAGASSIGDSSGSAFGSLSDTSTGSSSLPAFSSSTSSFANVSEETGENAPIADDTNTKKRSSSGSIAAPSSAKNILTPSSLQMVAPVEYVEEQDPTGNLFMSLTLAFALIASLLGMFAIIPSLSDIPGRLTNMLFDGSKQTSSLPLVFGLLLGLGLVTGILGFVLRSKKQEA